MIRSIAPARAGLTLLEVVLATVLLGGVVFIVLAATTSFGRGAAASTVSLDMDRDAERILGALRRDIRQTGYRMQGSTGVPMLELPSTAHLRLRRRIGPGLGPEAWSPRADSGAWIELTLVQDGLFQPTRVPRFRLVRTDPAVGPDPTHLAGGVSGLTFAWTAPARSVEVKLSLARLDPAAQGVPALLVREYHEHIRVMNPAW